MLIPQNSTGLYTDFYELRMAQGYYLSEIHKHSASFDYFFRSNPYHGGYTVFAGLDDLLTVLQQFRFSDEDTGYLKKLGFKPHFLEYLKDIRFTGQVFSVSEGEIVFPNEPIVRVEGELLQCQLIESLLLNILNFQSLIATKAARMRLAAGDATLIDFGMRRAQGPGALYASRAAIIGGFDATSNTHSAYRYNLTPSGTMSHSWIQSFDSEIDAFKAFVSIYPDNSILLVDTYDTLKSGVPNAIRVAKELEKDHKRLQGIRLDSGDLEKLSKKARILLDKAGLSYVKIVVSNQVDEYVIQKMNEQLAPVDAFGVGTALAVGAHDCALDGVYKLAEINGKPTMKTTDNPSKITMPGRKNIYRYYDTDKAYFFADGIELQEEKPPFKIYERSGHKHYSDIRGLQHELLIDKVMTKGEILMKRISPTAIATLVKERLKRVPEKIKRLDYPAIFLTGLGSRLKESQLENITETA